MQTYTRDERLRLIANIIAVVAALFSLGGAAISALPLYLDHQRQIQHRDGLVAGLASGEPHQVLTARTHVTADSPADVFIRNLDDWWYAQLWSSARGGSSKEPAAGSTEGVGDGYRVCLPKLLPGERVCFQLADFIHDPSTGLINRFSVDGVPVDSRSWNKNSEDLIGKRGLPLTVRAVGRIDLVAQHVHCVSYLISMETGSSKTMMHFNLKRFVTQDINENRAKNRFLWPGRLHRFETATAVVCVPDYGGWIQIARQRSATNKGVLGTE